MNYADRIKGLREDHDLNQTQIAKILHVAQTTYSDYETQKVRMPIDLIILLARYYDVDMNYISGVSRHKKPFPSES